MSLERQLRQLRDAERGDGAPPRIEARLLREFDRQHTARPRVRTGVFAAAAMAAGVLAGVTGTILYVRQAPAPPTLTAESVGESVVLVVGPPGVEETVRVVRIRVARAALASLGIDTVAQGSENVEVDVLVGEDGVARGVRLAM